MQQSMSFWKNENLRSDDVLENQNGEEMTNTVPSDSDKSHKLDLSKSNNYKLFLFQ